MALEGGEGSASHPGHSLPPGKTWYPLYRRLGGPQVQSGQVRKISPPPRFDPQTVQPIASRYTGLHYLAQITDSTDRKPLWNRNVPVPGFTVTSKFYCIKWILKKEAVNVGAGFSWLQVWFQWQAFVMTLKIPHFYISREFHGHLSLHNQVFVSYKISDKWFISYVNLT